jgi:electron transport complex protein RnfG
MKHVISPAVYLFVIAAVATALLVAVHAITLEPIQNQLRQTQEKMMLAVFPDADEFSEFETSVSGSMVSVVEAKEGGNRVGFVISVAPMGYAGAIEMVVGISSKDNEVTGMRVVKHSETPGFGDAATKEPFFSKFEGRPLNAMTVVRSGAAGDEIDSIAASTITTVAIIQGVNDAIEWYKGGGF